MTGGGASGDREETIGWGSVTPCSLLKKVRHQAQLLGDVTSALFVTTRGEASLPVSLERHLPAVHPDDNLSAFLSLRRWQNCPFSEPLLSPEPCLPAWSWGGRGRSELPSGFPTCLLVLSVTGESRRVLSAEGGLHAPGPTHWAMLGEPRGPCVPSPSGKEAVAVVGAEQGLWDSSAFPPAEGRGLASRKSSGRCGRSVRQRCPGQRPLIRREFLGPPGGSPSIHGDNSLIRTAAGHVGPRPRDLGHF